MPSSQGQGLRRKKRKQGLQGDVAGGRGEGGLGEWKGREQRTKEPSAGTRRAAE